MVWVIEQKTLGIRDFLGQRSSYSPSGIDLETSESKVNMITSMSKSYKAKDWNIDKHRYIGTWILWIYQKYRWIFLHKYQWDKNYPNLMRMLRKLQKMIK